MNKTIKLKNNTKTLTIKELTVKEFRNWVHSMTDNFSCDTFEENDFTMRYGMSHKQIQAFTDAEINQDFLDDLYPSDIELILKTIEETNKDFLDIRNRTKQALNLALNQQLKTSTEVSQV